MTQLYTDEIVRIILKGVKNEILLDMAYGIPVRRQTPKHDSLKVLPCVMLQNHMNDKHHQTYQDEATVRSLLCGAFRRKVTVRLYQRCWDTEPDPEAICNTSSVAMATGATSSTVTRDGKVIVQQFQACRPTVLVLEAITSRGFGNQIPARFTTWAQEAGTVSRWIEAEVPVRGADRR